MFNEFMPSTVFLNSINQVRWVWRRRARMRWLIYVWEATLRSPHPADTPVVSPRRLKKEEKKVYAPLKFRKLVTIAASGAPPAQQVLDHLVNLSNSTRRALIRAYYLAISNEQYLHVVRRRLQLADRLEPQVSWMELAQRIPPRVWLAALWTDRYSLF
jgi:hypothetical protein